MGVGYFIMVGCAERQFVLPFMSSVVGKSFWIDEMIVDCLLPNGDIRKLSKRSSKTNTNLHLIPRKSCRWSSLLSIEAIRSIIWYIYSEKNWITKKVIMWQLLIGKRQNLCQYCSLSWSSVWNVIISLRLRREHSYSWLTIDTILSR
jgi:hypothetical protein